MMHDVRVALRQHLRQRGFAATVVATLAVTIGATAAMFTVVHTVLVRALPFAAPARLVWIASVRPDNPSAPFSLPEFLDYRRQTSGLAGLAAYANWSASLAGDAVTERLQGARMSANAFDVLGVSPAAGRLLDETDDRADAAPVVVLSHRLWQRRFGGSADAVGRTARINGESFVIVGVLPARFPLPLRDIDVVTPLAADRDPLRHVRNSVNFLRLFGRLAPGTDADRAQAELNAICRALREQFPVEYARKAGVQVVTLQEAIVGDVRRSMLLLFGAVIVVLGTALANLTSLALIRAHARRGELSVRTALGASRLHLARQLACEAVCLAGLGGALGWVLATQAVTMLALWAPPSIPRLGEMHLDVAAALVVAAIAAGASLLLTAAPLVAVARARATGAAIRDTSRGSIGDRWNHRVRRALVVSELAAALVLLLGTMALVQGLLRLSEVPLGFDPDGVFQARVSIPSSYRTLDDVARFYDRLSERLVTAPGVQRLGVISVAPLSGLLATVPFSVEGQPQAERDTPSANLRVISPGYPATVGTRLRRGRAFAESDRANAPNVALVSAALADRFMDGDAVGRRLLVDDNNEAPRPVEVVGILENVRQTALDGPPAFDIYLPLRQVHPDGLIGIRNNQFWMIETRSDPAAFRETFLAHLRSVDADAAVSGTGGMRRFVDEWLGPRRFNLGLFTAFALTAVLLAVLGLHGLVSYAVSQRAREIGLRLAIGASTRAVHWMIVRDALVSAAAGIALGLLVAAAGRPLFSSTAQEAGIGVGAVASTAALLVAVVAMAAWLPARRAARIDPTVTLKTP